MPATRIFGSLRASLPNPNVFGCEKHEVLNHWVLLAWELSSGILLQPTATFGRGAPAPKLVLNVVGWANKGMGKPFSSVVTPFTPQPETSLSATPETLPRKRFPLPNGRSTT